MFLFRDGSFTLMKMASLMFLAMLLSSLPTIVKLSRETSFSITPDEALVETRRKLVIKKKILVLYRENEDLWSN